MLVFILTFIIIALSVLALSLSLLYGRGAIKGSCGPTADLPGFDAGDGCSGACGAKPGDEPDCKRRHACRHQREENQVRNG